MQFDPNTKSSGEKEIDLSVVCQCDVLAKCPLTMTLVPSVWCAPRWWQWPPLSAPDTPHSWWDTQMRFTSGDEEKVTHRASHDKLPQDTHATTTLPLSPIGQFFFFFFAPNVSCNGSDITQKFSGHDTTQFKHQTLVATWTQTQRNPIVKAT